MTSDEYRKKKRQVLPLSEWLEEADKLIKEWEAHCADMGTGLSGLLPTGGPSNSPEHKR